MLGEVFALQRALTEVEFRRAIQEFFLSQSEEATLLCRLAMQQRPPQIEQAIGFAAQSQLAQESFNKLEAFVKEQLARQ